MTEMTIALPAHIAEKLESLAATKHTTVEKLIESAATSLVDTERISVEEASNQVLDKYEKLYERLA